jgi:thymidylate synthase (FAD)
MIVELLAHTKLVEETAEDLGYQWNEVDSVLDADDLHELAGRECYQSFHRPNPATNTNEKYLGHILEVGHFSVLEHSSMTLTVRQVSRSFTHELVRHRHLSYSQVSQRYVDESSGGLTVPKELTGPLAMHLADLHQTALDAYAEAVSALMAEGLPIKRARQAARSVLPNGHHTRLIVSGNIRAWREMVAKRASFNDQGEPYADLEIFEFARRVLEILHNIAPNSVQDLWQTLYLEWEKTPYGIAQAGL